MSGSSLPYQLRPNKFIDRQVFIDLLQRFLPYIGIEKYAYISMGGKHLVDHRAVYRQVGITALYSFDMDHEIVRRQEVNKPIDGAICEQMSSGELPGKLDEIASLFPDTTNFIIWLDYTAPGSRLTQMQEFVAILARLQAGDLVKLTMNANQDTLGPSSKWKDMGFSSPQEYRAHAIKEQLGEFVPSTLDSVDDGGFPRALAECAKMAVAKAELETNSITFLPIMSISYRDGQRMFSITVIALDDAETSSALLDSITQWDFASKDWTDVKVLDAPDLSQREKMRIDQWLSSPANAILDAIDFLPGENHHTALVAVDSYQKLHRYYPTFHHVEL